MKGKMTLYLLIPLIVLVVLAVSLIMAIARIATNIGGVDWQTTRRHKLKLYWLGVLGWRIHGDWLIDQDDRVRAECDYMQAGRDQFTMLPRIRLYHTSLERRGEVGEYSVASFQRIRDGVQIAPALLATILAHNQKEAEQELTRILGTADWREPQWRAGWRLTDAELTAKFTRALAAKQS
jgi:hypothetical protein